MWNWLGTIGKRLSSNGKSQFIEGPIPDLDLIEWCSRKVIIAFDTNVCTEESVQAARLKLTKELSKRKAIVHWLHWPADTPSCVNGLDDLLALWSTERVRDLILAAKPYREFASLIGVLGLCPIQ